MSRFAEWYMKDGATYVVIGVCVVVTAVLISLTGFTLSDAWLWF